MPPKLRIIGVGSHGHVRQVQVKQVNSTELSGYSFHNLYNKNGPSDIPRPSNRSFSLIPGIFYGKLFFSRSAALSEKLSELLGSFGLPFWSINQLWGTLVHFASMGCQLEHSPMLPRPRGVGTK